ncbi:MAG: MBL fold metallo-hydrolase [Bdellovibrionales bacterium]|nr:MBL fold metallo-hydrolase [Bdellovibrionales bacterium]
MISIQHFFDIGTSTLTYVVWDSLTNDGIVIDPVWNYEAATATLSTESIEQVSAFLKKSQINIHWILETHAHADHISGAQVLKNKYPNAKIAMGERITELQKAFKPHFDLQDLNTEGGQFDRLFKNNEIFQAGSIKIKVLFTPGHTPACCSYVIEDAVFTGDCLLMPDSGTGRCDFPGGSADTLFTSISEILFNLPETTRVFVGHDYQPQNRDLKFQCQMSEEKRGNIHLNNNTSRADYIRFRVERDSSLKTPRLLLPSIQLNIAAGKLPNPRPDGKHYLIIPLLLKT